MVAEQSPRFAVIKTMLQKFRSRRFFKTGAPHGLLKVVFRQLLLNSFAFGCYPGFFFNVLKPFIQLPAECQGQFFFQVSGPAFFVLPNTV